MPSRKLHSREAPPLCRSAASALRLLIWLPRAVVDKLAALRGPGESYSDVILRMAAGERR